jgi:hypothetical protein
MVSNIRSWLRKKPEPSHVRCTCTDGVSRVIKIDTKSGRRFHDTEQSINEMAATKLEALDPKGHTLRMCELEVPEEERPAVEAKNAQEHSIVLIARELAMAYKTGATQHREQTDLAFTKFNELLSIIFTRLAQIENRQAREWNARFRTIDAAGDGTDEQTALAQQMFMAFLQAQQPGAVPPAAGKANGAAPPAAEPAAEEDEEA